MVVDNKRLFRLARGDDWQQIASLDEAVLGSAARAQLLRQAISEQRCYLITSSGELAAFAVLHHHFFGHAFLDLLVVDERFRRQGIGKMLLTALCEVCQTDRLFTSTNASNQPMQRLLQTCGWRRSGFVDDLDPGDPELFYCRSLRPNTDAPWEVVQIGQSLRSSVATLLAEHWGSSVIVSRGRAHQAAELPGFVALAAGRLLGLVTYQVEGTQCQIVTLDSLHERQGIGAALLERVVAVAKEAGCRRVWLITTNDNTPAIRYYQRHGFDLVALHRRALEVSRQIKPEIPPVGLDGIPLRHELEFERLL